MVAIEVTLKKKKEEVRAMSIAKLQQVVAQKACRTLVKISSFCARAVTWSGYVE